MFRKIEITDKARFNEFKIAGYAASELNFANIFAWKSLDQLEIYDAGDFILIKGGDFFFPPLVKDNNFTKAIAFIDNYCLEKNFVFNILGITEELLPFFNLPNTIVYPHHELNEYLYHASDLMTFKGKKLHSKRNLLNQFEKNYQYQFIAYDESLKDGVIKLIDNWTEQKSITYEMEGIISILDNLEALDCFCDCLIIDNEVQAFSIGTINTGVGLVLFEKANTNYIGIYPAIVSYFANKHFQNIEYINRQEDMGIENLRISKMSYQPCGFINKYQLTKTIDQQLIDIYNLSFHDSKNYQEFFFTSKNKQVKYVTNNNIITSTLYYRDETLVVRGKQVKVAFIFALATHPLYRYLGYMRVLLTGALQELSNDYLLVYLHPDVNSFYNRFDFVYFGVEAKTEKVDTPVSNLNTVKKIYDEVAKHTDGYIKRPLTKWNKIYDELKVDEGVIFANNNTYQVFDGDSVIESLSTNSTLTRSKIKMLRILKLEQFMNLFNIYFEEDLKVVDNIIDDNNIVINDESKARMINIEELSQIIVDKLIILALEMY